MAQTNVSSCVLSIIASFSGALDVFKKLKGKRTRRKRSEAGRANDEELHLARSLRQGPKDIGREYQRSVQVVGDQIAIGDAVAQISLAEILLKLNIGLVGIINSFLHGDKNSLRLDYRSLTDLSERSRMDTCRTLRQLHRRSMHVRLPPTVVPHNAPHPGSQDPTEADRKRKGRSMNKPARIRGPTLARITIQGAQSSQIALVKPVERRNKSASMSDLSKVRSGVSTPLSRPSPHADALIAPQPRPMAIRSHTLPGAPRPRGKQSTSRIDVTSQHPARKDMHRAGAQSTFGLAQLRTSKPDTGPVPAMGPQHRSPIPTYYSVASNGTKLGEIPLHKWAEHFDFDAMSAVNRETENNEWPLVDLTDRKKRRFNFLGMFRRKEKLPG